MKKIVRLIPLIAVLVVASNSNATTGAAFLRVPNGTRDISLGMSGVASTTGGSAAVTNPARIGSSPSELGIQFFRWLADGRGTFATATFQFSRLSFGAYLMDLSIGEFEARDRPGPPASIFTVHQSILAAGASVKLPYAFSAGMTLKGYLDEIYGDSESLFPLTDIGLAWEKANWSAGASVSNINLDHEIYGETPLTTRVGASRKFLFDNYSILTLAEFSNVKNQISTLHLGLEGSFKSKFFLRAGLASSEDNTRPTFGLGLSTGVYVVDFAMALYDRNLGTPWRIGLGYLLK